MLIHFDEMSPDSRIWIYQSNQPLSVSSAQLIKEHLISFLSGWESHGNPLKASWKLFYNQFLVIAVDEHYYPASGCSIDKSVQMIKELETQLGTELLGKGMIAVLEEENKVSTVALKDLKKEISEHKITKETIIFNNLVPTLRELERNWKVPVEKTWLSKYFNN